jgi:hypothetical protein
LQAISTIVLALLFAIVTGCAKPLRTPAEGGGTLYIDKIVMHKTPQSGTWRMCIKASADGVDSTFNPNKEFEDDEITIDTPSLKMRGVRSEVICSFLVHLDDDKNKVCKNTAEDRSTGDFKVHDLSGNPGYEPIKDRWKYTIYWHWEAK